ncbi:MAG: PKD domain-containing protein [Prolixibacteraceae bacterium]
MLFAGSDTRTLANPIQPVLDRFNVTIDDGSGGGTANVPPNADFTYSATDLTVSFSDQSSDSDGSIVSWNWNFGDGSTSTAQNPTISSL